MTGSGGRPLSAVDAARMRMAAARYAAEGYSVFKVWGMTLDGRCQCGTTHADPKSIGKHPVGGHGHREATTDADVVSDWWPEETADRYNIGIYAADSGCMVIDVDPRHGGVDSFARLTEDIGGLPDTVEALTGLWSVPILGDVRGRHLYYRVPEGIRLHGKLAQYPGLDFKHQGFLLAPPSRHLSGILYEWVAGRDPVSFEPAEIPARLLEMLSKGTSRATNRVNGTGSQAGSETSFGSFEWDGERIDVDAVLEKGIYEGERINVLYPIMCSLANDYPVAKAHGAASFTAVIKRINRDCVHPPLPDEELDVQIARAMQFVLDSPKSALPTSVLRGVSQDVIDALAAGSPGGPSPAGGGGGHGLVGSAAGGVAGIGNFAISTDLDELALDDEEGDPETDDVLRRSLTDRGNARRLADHYRGVVKYADGLGWLWWNERQSQWVVSSKGSKVMNLAGAAIGPLMHREALSILDPEEQIARVKWGDASKSTRALKSAMEQWQAMDGVGVPVTSVDADAELLGVRNGIINLRTGELFPATPEYLITKRTRVAYSPGIRAARWDEFLKFACDGDVELMNYLQLAAGYTLTGNRDHECFFLVYGPAGSGKSTFLSALGALLDDYHAVVPVDALTEAPGKAGTNLELVLAGLFGKRMAEVSEWPEARNTREDVIKQLTGETKTRGKFLFQNPFDFESTAKLWIGTNVKPRINERAMWRRTRTINFHKVPEKMDPGLKNFLIDPDGGLPAVLAWAVEGAVKLLGSSVLQPLGVDQCGHVKRENEEYQRQEDRIGMFLTEELDMGTGFTVLVKTVYEMYADWSDDRGEKAMSRIRFENKLKESGREITGMGSSAVLNGYKMKLKAASAPVVGAGGTDWGSLISS